MNARTKAPKAQLLLTLDSASDNRGALDTAVRLAVQLRAELLGLFLEDSDLLGIAELPFAHEILHWSAGERSLSAGGLERSLKALAARVQQELFEAAREADIGCLFRVQRGPRLQLLLEAGEQYDLVLVGGRRRNAAAGRAAGRQVRHEPMVYVAFTGAKAGKRALRAGAALLRTQSAQLTVFILGPDRASTAQLHAEAIRRLEKAGLIARLIDCPADNAEPSVLERLAGLAGIALVLPADTALAQPPEGFRQLLERIGCPLLLVR